MTNEPQLSQNILPIVVLVSGNGSNLQAIIDAIASGKLHAQIRLVISNKPNAYAIRRAQKANIPVVTISHLDFTTREQFDSVLVQTIHSTLRADAAHAIVVLAGFMRILSSTFLNQFQRRIINIHPSLLPQFRGMHAITQALETHATKTGCTIHIVTSEVDAGPILGQQEVHIFETDTPETLRARIQKQEHQLLVKTLHKIQIGVFDLLLYPTPIA